MKDSRTQILNRIREATKSPSNLPDLPEGTERKLQEKRKAVTPDTLEERVHQFQNELEALSAEFFRVPDHHDISAKIKDILKQSSYSSLAFADNSECRRVAESIAEGGGNLTLFDAVKLTYPDRKYELAEVPAGLVKASYAVADIGSLVFPYDDNGTSLVHFLPDCIFAIVEKQHLVSSQFELFECMDPEKAKNMVFVAGPSRTADIEKVLVLGAHGPRRLVVFMIDNS